MKSLKQFFCVSYLLGLVHCLVHLVVGILTLKQKK